MLPLFFFVKLSKFKLFLNSIEKQKNSLSNRINSCVPVMNNYQAAAAAAHSFGPSASPHAAAATTATRQGFPSTNSPGPTIDMYSSAAADNVGYVQATSPQPSGFPIAVSRAPLNYSPVSRGYLSPQSPENPKPLNRFGSLGLVRSVKQ